jgi:hypothetical protein
MQTKESIIETLLEKKYITVKEAVILLKDSHISYGDIRYINPQQHTINTLLAPKINHMYPFPLLCNTTQPQDTPLSRCITDSNPEFTR